jgi:putative hemolysin
LGQSLEPPSTELIGILVCMMVGAAFAAVDEAMIAFGAARMRAARERQDSNGRAATRYLTDAASIQARLLAGRVLCNAGTAVFAAHAGFVLFGLWGAAIATAVAALTYATTVSVATTFVVRRASRLALPLLRFCRPLELLMLPLAVPMFRITALINRAFPARPEDAPERVTEVDVEQMIDQGEEHGSITEEHAELLRSVLEFTDTVTREVMVPRTAMVAFAIDTPLEQVVRSVIARGHSRYPVYRERIDQIEGILYAKDLFRVVGEQGKVIGDLASVIRQPVFYSAESQKISELLREMQARRTHVAIVIDEFGGTSGMVTLEDIIEEIVGEIRDEHDGAESPVRRIAPGRYIANAAVSVHDVAELTGLQIPEDAGDYDSLGGMIVDIAGRVPSRGESIEVGSHHLIIRDADERHVTRVELVSRGDVPSAAE